jgi:hypothetical protein
MNGLASAIRGTGNMLSGRNLVRLRLSHPR